MARQSAKSQSVPVTTNTQVDPYLKPATGLTDLEKHYWQLIVSNRPAEYFKSVDIPILTQCVRHISTSHVLDEQIKAITPEQITTDDGFKRYQKLQKMMDETTSKIIACLRTMRLTHQAIWDAKTGHTAAGEVDDGEKPWE